MGLALIKEVDTIPTKPTTHPPDFAAIPDCLTEAPQWVLWRYEWKEEEGKYSKVPYSAHTLSRASSTAPRTWAPFNVAVQSYMGHKTRFDGIGFVFTTEDDFVGIDFDHCITVNEESGELELTEFAKAWMDSFESYTEITPSGSGLHIIIKGKLPQNIRHKVSQLGIEAYEHGRYFTMTGRSWHESPLLVAARPTVLQSLTTTVLKREEPPTPAPVTAQTPTLDAKEILDRAFNAANGPKLRALFNGDKSSHSNDHSSADMALCSMLAFWTGSNHALLDSLFRQSALMRPKWDAKHYADGSTYGAITVQRAIEHCREVYNPNRQAQKAQAVNGKADTQTPAETPANGQQDGKIGYAWEEPIGFDEVKLPAFPTSVLPPYLADFVTELAESTQTPHDLCGTITLTAIAAAIHGKIQLVVKPGWVEWSTLYTLTAAPSGSRKSAVFKAVIGPIVEYERKLREQEKPLIERNRRRRDALNAQYKRHLEAINKAKDGQERADAQECLAQVERELGQITKLEPTRLLVEDVTTERLVTLLGKHNERLAILSPEGDVFKLIAGMYNANGKANLSIYLKAYDGEFCRIDRQDQERTVFLDRPSLTIGLSVQPAVIRRLAEEPEFQDRGLIQRFLFSLTPDILGYRNLTDAKDISEPVRRKYVDAMNALLSIEHDLDSEMKPQPITARFAPAAIEKITEFQLEVETLLQDRAVPDALREWRSKLPGKMARLALILALADRAVDGSMAFEKPIQPEYVEKAVELAHYYMAHCEAAFGLMASDLGRGDAVTILKWIKSQGKLAFSRRDCYRGLQRHFKNPDCLSKGLRLLFQLGYIQRDQAHNQRGALWYQVNPSWLDATLSEITCQQGR
jgi:hypothetical protein